MGVVKGEVPVGTKLQVLDVVDTFEVEAGDLLGYFIVKLVNFIVL